MSALRRADEPLTAADEQDWLAMSEALAVLESMAKVFSDGAAGSLTIARAVEPQLRPALVQPAAVGIVILDHAGIVHSFSPAAKAIFGYDAKDVVGQHARLILDCPAEPEGALFDLLRQEGNGRTIELSGRRRDRTTFAAGFSPGTVEIGGETLLTVAIWDLSAGDAAEAERRATEARYRSLIEQIPAVTFMGALSGDVIELYVSPQIEALLGFSQEKWLSDPFLWYNQLHPDDRDRCNLEFARGCRDGGPFRAEFRALTRGGDIVWIRGEARMVRDEHGRPIFIQGIGYDITESKRAEESVRAHAEQMKTSLAEKEVLLQEIHHRVKNNLQVISSLLKLQSIHVQDAAALEMFNESRHRIHSMALVHEKLYQSGNLSHIDLGEYVRSLTSLLWRSYRARSDAISINTEIRDVFVGIDVAVPLGMIINELVSNSLKYAFPPGRGGKIQLQMHRGEDASYTLRIADDGVGFPADLDYRQTQTLGMQLVRMLTQQIGGSIELVHGGGTEFHITFRE